MRDNTMKGERQRVVAWVEPQLAKRIAEVARQNERSISAELRRILRAAYLKENR